MAPMTRSRAKLDGTPGELAAEYYAQRAGVGRIFIQIMHAGRMSHPDNTPQPCPLGANLSMPQRLRFAINPDFYQRSRLAAAIARLVRNFLDRLGAAEK
jgi:2,4-dienoyl-CoA reductase-like NADH-dependent reductase (Old Yellow Enzyme family)